MAKRREHFWTDDEDRETLQLIRAVFGVSKSAAFRVAIRAAREKLGLTKETKSENLIKKL